MLTSEGLARILLAGAEALDRYNACMTHGADNHEPCTDDQDRPVHCTQRVSGDPVLAHTLRAMARECRRP